MTGDHRVNDLEWPSGRREVRILALSTCPEQYVKGPNYSAAAGRL